MQDVRRRGNSQEDRFLDAPEARPVLEAAATFLFAGMANQEQGREKGWQGIPPATARQRFYVDTMGFDSASIRFAIELLGAEHVLLGSDWPIMPITPRQRIEDVLAPLGLSNSQRTAILGGNTLRLLTSHRPSR